MNTKHFNNIHITILPPTSQLLSDSHVPLSTLYPHMHMFVCIFHRFQLELSSVDEGTFTELGQPTRCHIREESWLSLPQQPLTVKIKIVSQLWVGLVNLSPLRVGMLTGLISYQSCSKSYSCCEFILLFLRQFFLCSPGLSGTCQPFVSASWLVGL